MRLITLPSTSNFQFLNMYSSVVTGILRVQD
jgi:hypothetical protein